jgi:hypothetical protein
VRTSLPTTNALATLAIKLMTMFSSLGYEHSLPDPTDQSHYMYVQPTNLIHQ